VCRGGGGVVRWRGGLGVGGGWWGGVAGQDHVHCYFVWHNAKSFYCFNLWEKAALHFQCILKNLLYEKITSKLHIGPIPILYHVPVLGRYEWNVNHTTSTQTLSHPPVQAKLNY